MRFVYLSVLAVALTGTAFGNHLDPTEPPGSLLVTRAGFEWVWASPRAADPEGEFGVPIDLHHGFVLPSTANWLASFSGFPDLYDAFNPVSGQLCASAYFNSGSHDCNNENLTGEGGIPIAVWGAPFAGNASAAPYAETFLVRGVPEPGTLALLVIGLAGLATTKRRRSA